jgi:hypothetical protein
MTTFTVGDHVRWNWEGGEVEGRITKVQTKDVSFWDARAAAALKNRNTRSPVTRPAPRRCIRAMR